MQFVGDQSSIRTIVLSFVWKFPGVRTFLPDMFIQVRLLMRGPRVVEYIVFLKCHVLMKFLLILVSLGPVSPFTCST